MTAAIVRFWWVVTLGAVLGVLLAAWMLYDLPSLEARDRQVWTANARLFVTSSEGQYIRVSVPRSIEQGTPASTAEGGAAARGGGAVVTTEPPNVQPLLTAANLYPLLIESDDVARLRTKLYGKLQGTVIANAFTAVSTPTRFLPAQLPVIDIFATSSTPSQAVTLADATAKTFTRFIRTEQDRAGLSTKERIQIKQLKAPGQTMASGGPSYGLPLLVALAVAAAFCILAVLLDQLLPRRAPAPPQALKWGSP